MSTQVAAAAARGESAIGVLGNAGVANLLVVDIGMDNSLVVNFDHLVTSPGELHHARVTDGSADITVGPAMSPTQFAQAMETGARLARELASFDDAGVDRASAAR